MTIEEYFRQEADALVALGEKQEEMLAYTRMAIRMVQAYDRPANAETLLLVARVALWLTQQFPEGCPPTIKEWDAMLPSAKSADEQHSGDLTRAWGFK